LDESDLNLFDYDYDLTFMVFFLDPDENIYARYGGRDGKDPERRMSLEGLRTTMLSVLDMHQQKEPEFAPRDHKEPKYVRNIAPNYQARGCMHCHDVKEALYNNLKYKNQWSTDLAWRYPLPDNLGFELDVDRSNVVKKVKEKSPAASAGMQPGDRVVKLLDVPVHSFGDAQFALDRAPKIGSIPVTWLRDNKPHTARLELYENWRKTDISWRPSMLGMIPSLNVFGPNLKTDERKELGLSEKQLAFRQLRSVNAAAKKAGIEPGDVILGINDQKFEMDVIEFLQHVRRSYIIGDQVTINVLRGEEHLKIPMTLSR
jgi:hypothetical protein